MAAGSLRSQVACWEAGVWWARTSTASTQSPRWWKYAAVAAPIPDPAPTTTTLRRWLVILASLLMHPKYRQ
ncbi:hypothetical protein MHIB_27840 [Mycolicibacter hiberniae]|uniref:Uncharacterized protein n=1 Tax=Mycolicibacter hiberniae TaxID=29314 RepID=A0A7I7X3W7_9MYCO|nr:hypothetical protein MHIB_27840 [Mycolicibacter hiberniae]